MELRNAAAEVGDLGDDAGSVGEGEEVDGLIVGVAPESAGDGHGRLLEE